MAEHITLTPYAHNEVIRSALFSTKSDLHINDLVFQGDTLSMSFLMPGKLTISPIGEILYMDTVSCKRYKNSIIIHQDQDFPYASTKAQVSLSRSISLKIKNKPEKTLIEKASYGKNIKMASVIKHERFGDWEYYGVSRHFIRVNKNGLINYLSFDSEILDFDLSEERLVIATLSGVYEVNEKFKTTSHYLKDEGVSAILKDKDSGFWFSTLSGGIFYTPSLETRVLEGSENTIPTSLHVINNQLVCGNNNIELIVFTEDGIFKENGNSRISGLTYSLTANKIESLGEGFRNIKKSLVIYGPEIKYQQGFLCGGGTIYVVKNNKFEMFKPESPYITCYSQSTDSSVLIGTKRGLYEMSSDLVPVIKPINGIDSSAFIRNLFHINDYLVVLLDNGVFAESDETSFFISTSEHLVNNYLSGISKSIDNSFWAYGFNGIEKVDLKKGGFSSTNYNEFDFLPSNEVSSLLENDSLIFIGTKKGICVIEKRKLTSGPVINRSNFSIDSVISSNFRLDISDTISLTEGSNNLSIYFNYIQFDKRKISVEYQFGSNQWIKTDGTSIHFPSIGNGHHELHFRAVYKKEVLQLNTLFIIVPTPFYYQLWFIPTIMLIVFLLLFLLFRRLLLKRQRKEQEKNKIEMSLLASRMNPHFTFNTISSIQSYILKNEKAPAIKYLSDFGLLMRKTLDYSYQDHINFSDEIGFLKLLVTLENKRFESAFFLKVIRNDNGRNFKLPAMILQPLVENVILHAKYPEGADKGIEISVDQSDKHYILTVEDYGINGPVKTANANHKSVGLSIIKDRIILHNAKHFEASDFTIQQKQDTNNQGYKVTIKLIKK